MTEKIPKFRCSITIVVIIPHTAHIYKLSNTKETITLQAKQDRKNDMCYEICGCFKKKVLDKSLMHFSLSKLENLNIFWTYLMLVQQFDGIWTLFEVSCWVGLIDIFDYRWLLFLVELALLLFLLFPTIAVMNGLRMHYFELFFKTRLENFLFFQLFL